MTRKEFIEYFEAVWYDNFGLPHNAKELNLTWEVCIGALEEDGEKIDWNWKPTDKEVEYYCSCAD